MAIRKIARMGHPVLLQRAAEVDDPAEVQDLIRDMTETLVDSGGIGLAAPQVHESLRIILVSVPRNRAAEGEAEAQITTLINPVLTSLSEERALGWEGCLSIPGLRGAVPRFVRIRFEALNASGEPVAGEAHDLMARVLQHEIDHLDGILYPMRMQDHSQFGFDEEIGRYARGER